MNNRTYTGSTMIWLSIFLRFAFSLYESFFSIALAHSFLNTRSSASAHWVGYVLGVLNCRQFAKTNSMSLAKSSIVAYLPSDNLVPMVPKSIGSLISS